MCGCGGCALIMDTIHETTSERIAANLAHVYQRMGDAAARVGRDPADVALVAVSKKIKNVDRLEPQSFFNYIDRDEWYIRQE